VVVIERVVVIIHVRIAASRARRVIVRSTANMNIQGGMKFRLTGPHSRPKERHEGKRKGKERSEKRARRPEVGRERTAAGPLGPFSRLRNGRECLWVREDLHSEQMDIFGNWPRCNGRGGGNALDGNLNTMKGPWWRSKKNIQ
jgi:hypothetical protein